MSVTVRSSVVSEAIGGSTVCSEVIVDIGSFKHLLQKNIVYVIPNSSDMPMDKYYEIINWIKSMAVGVNIDAASSLQLNPSDAASSEACALRMNHDCVFSYSLGSHVVLAADDINRFKYTESTDTNYAVLCESLNDYLEWDQSGVITFVIVAVSGNTMMNITELLTALRKLYAGCEKRVVDVYCIGAGMHDPHMMEKLCCVATSESEYISVVDDEIMDTLRSVYAKICNRVSMKVTAEYADDSGKVQTARIPMVGVGNQLHGMLFGPPLIKTITIDTARGCKKFDVDEILTTACASEFSRRAALLYLRIRGFVSYLSNRLDAVGIASLEKNISMWSAEIDNISGLIYADLFARQYRDCVKGLRNIVDIFGRCCGVIKTKSLTDRQFASAFSAISQFDVSRLVGPDAETSNVIKLVDEIVNSDYDRSHCIGDINVYSTLLSGNVVRITPELEVSIESGFPLYLNDTHWNFSQVKPTREVLLDILKIVHKTVITLFDPDDNKSKRAQSVYDLVIATAVKVMSGIIDHTALCNNVRLFAHSGSIIRTSIDDLEMFAAEVLVGINANIAPMFTTPDCAISFFSVMREEMMRRNIDAKYKSMSDASVSEFICKVLGFESGDVPVRAGRYTTLHVRRYKALCESACKNLPCGNVYEVYGARLIALKDIDASNHNIYLDLPDIARAVDGANIYKHIDECVVGVSATIDTHGDSIDDFFSDECAKSLNAYAVLCGGSSLVRSNAYSAINDICMCLQNLMHRTKSLRNAAIRQQGFDPQTPHVHDNYTVSIGYPVSSRYVDMVSECGHERAITWLRNLYLESCADIIKREITAYTQSFVPVSNMSLRQRCRQFVAAATMSEAVGLLYGIKYGQASGELIIALRECGKCSDCVCSDDLLLPTRKREFICRLQVSKTIPHLKEKLILLNIGTYNGLKVVEDIERFGKLNMSRRNVHRLYKVVGMKQMFAELFPALREKIDVW